jgi:ATP-dependent Clp protease ATP-binding subunit ClpC
MGTGMDIEIQYHNTRALKARLGQQLGGALPTLFSVLAICLLIGGLALVATGAALGWLLIGIAALPAMLVEWWNGELKKVPPLRKSNSLTDTLDSQILGHLPKQATANQIASAVGQTPGAQFFSARFGITPSVLQDIVEPGVEASDIWRAAVKLRESLGLSEITQGVMVAAIVKQFPNHDALLAHVNIDFNDILEGIKWQERLAHLVKEHAKPRRTGGIARDWSFGYIPLLTRFGRNISSEVAGGVLTIETKSHQKTLEELIGLFGGNGRRNAVVTAPTGAGKTTLVYSFAEELMNAEANIPNSLKFRQVFMLDASALISAASGRGELEELIHRVLGEAYAAKNIIICLDNAQLFFEEGVGSIDVGNVLLPILEAGRLPIILTMDEQRYLQISQRNASVANTLNRIIMQPSNREETLEVLQNQLILTEFRQNVTYTYQSLVEAYRLSERYIYDIAMPGQAVKLLESAARYSESGLVTINSVQHAIEQTTGVKVSVASESEDREKLLNLEDLIHKRMINQARAVTVVSDALRRARAGVRNESRPIGTFLFLGPTGVGKTELARALADVYFGGEDRMIRLDLNEYVRNEDVARLIADGASDATSLTAQVMKQPYSVVLLDEIEKAHPNVLTTLLQLLDEGILRDINNREVSFRDAIIIATSNAGADRIREYIQRGHKMEQFENQFIDELISSNQFKPEFLNRFDEIVLFTPLGKKELLQVVDLMIEGVNKTLAQQKVSVMVEDSAKQLLVERGYDPRLGARPMRRVVQRAVENTVAKAMLSGSVQPGTTIDITKEQVETMLGTAKAASDILASTNESEGED